LFSSFYGASTPPAQSEKSQKPKEITPVAHTARVDRPITLEEYVREYYRDTPVLAHIAKCESSFRHLGGNGTVLRGETAPEDLGVMQINEFYHEERAEKLGLDLHTLDGNLAYAKWLYSEEGTLPWFASSKCWKEADILAKSNIKTVTN
jgi:acetyl-CoA acetyltransferase